MSEYPEDIMKAAYEVTEKSIPAIIQPKDWDVIEEAIAAAILAERERCATVAKNWPLAKLVKTNDTDQASVFAIGARAQSHTVYAAILKGGAA